MGECLFEPEGKVFVLCEVLFLYIRETYLLAPCVSICLESCMLHAYGWLSSMHTVDQVSHAISWSVLLCYPTAPLRAGVKHVV